MCSHSLWHVRVNTLTQTVDGEGPERHEEAAAHLIQLVALGVLHVGHLDVEAARYVM